MTIIAGRSQLRRIAKTELVIPSRQNLPISYILCNFMLHMRVVSRKKLTEYYSVHAGSKTALEEWYKKVSKAEWQSLNELKQHFLSADYVGNHRVVFNIKGNDYRLVAIVIYVSQKVYIRWIGTHAAYDRIDAKSM